MTARVVDARFGALARKSAPVLALAFGLLSTLAAMSGAPALPARLAFGTVGVGLASAALLALFGGAGEAAGGAVAGRRLIWPLAQLASGVTLLVITLRAAVLGVLPAQVPLLAVLVPVVAIWLAFAFGVLLERVGVIGDEGGALPLLRRHGLWLAVVTAALHLPLLGSFGLIDPWETHYGEVAREMLARGDWISLWWVQDGWFWSKPILNFWLQGLSFALFGVEHVPDGMIANVASGLTPQPEWAVRLPVLGLAFVGQYALYVGARAYLGRRAAFFGSLVLATTPYWFLLTRQSMADMPYVACLCGAMGMLLLALATAPDERARTYEICLGFTKLRLSAWHLVLGSVLLLSLPQIVYLVSRNVTFGWGEAPFGLRLHRDVVWSGSFGNCGLPGNAGCAEDARASRAAVQPIYAAGAWAAALLALLWLKRRELRLKRLYYVSAWAFAALSFMAKGAPGLVLVLAVWLAFLSITGRLRELLEAELSGLLLVSACVAAPWFVQEYVRHGAPFIERLFIHDMYKRAFDHVHDTNAASGDDTSFRYYVWQLGYGLFPWTGIAAVATLRAIGSLFTPKANETADADERSSAGLGLPAQATCFFVLWQLAAFGMFNITGTKYHHYILPLVPAAALVAGVLLDELWALGGSLGTREPERGAADGGSQAPLLAVLALGATVLVGFAGRDLVMDHAGDIEGQIRLLHLFTYNYERPWPGVLDFRAELAAFSALAVVAGLAFAIAPLRRVAALASCAVALAFAAWTSSVYLVKASPHWGQRETISEYYKKRSGPAEPLVAYQLNWKGENFYTGNQIATFVSTGKKFTSWVQEQKAAGVGVIFVTTEHTRMNSLKRELGSVEHFEPLTDESLNNKFGLVRVVL